MAKRKLLFICTANINRSRAAEDLFKNSEKYEARSAGFMMISGRSGQVVTQELVNWADNIFVMDELLDGHLRKLKLGFNLSGKQVDVLNITDMFDKEDPFLKNMLSDKLARYGVRP